MPVTPYDRTWVHPSSGLRPYYLSYEDATNWPNPVTTFTPVRTVPYTTKAQLTSAISGIQGGDFITYTGTGVLTITSSTASDALLIDTVAPATPAVIDFGHPDNANHVKFTQTSATTGWHGLETNRIQNLWFYGGEMTSNEGDAWSIHGAINCKFIDFSVHNAGSTGICAFPNYTNVSGCWFRGRSHDNGQDPTTDSHPEKGTGIHGSIMSDGGANSFINNTVMLYVYDQPTGAAVQWGDSGTMDLSNNTFFIKAERLTKVALSQTAGNAWEIWGSAKRTNVVVELIQGTDLQGRVVDAQSLTASTVSITVKHGRAKNTNLNTSLNETQNTYPFDPRYPTKITYQDCF